MISLNVFYFLLNLQEKVTCFYSLFLLLSEMRRRQ